MCLLPPSISATRLNSSRPAPSRFIPEGDRTISRPFVEIEWTRESKAGQREKIRYDFLINATGPKLNFGATAGLGPGKNSLSVCSAEHAAETSTALHEAVDRMRRGERQRFLVGTGHGSCTCEGAAFEYVVNLEFELRARGVRDKADIVFLTNEYELGDFGMDGVHIRQAATSRRARSSRNPCSPSAASTGSPGPMSSGSILACAHSKRSTGKREVAFDFAMLLPPFTGVGLTAFGRTGEDITSQLFRPNGFMKVDADYEAKPYEQWCATDWPRTYQIPAYAQPVRRRDRLCPAARHLPPGPDADGAPIAPAPPRTGMPSAMIGKSVARSIVDMIGGSDGPTQRRRWRRWARPASLRPEPIRSRGRPRR